MRSIYLFLIDKKRVFLQKKILKVIIFVSTYNPQITKAHVIKLHKSKITLNCGLSMLVGISEAIRMLFFFTPKEILLFLLPLLCSELKAANNFIFSLFIQPKKNSNNYDFYNDCLLNRSYGQEVYKPEIEEKNLKSLVVCLTDPNGLNAESESHNSKSIKPEDIKFNQWLAGLIDGDGCFLLSKKGYASLEIVAHIRDKNCLYQIKQKFGGAIKLRTNLNHLRYRMHHKQGMLDIINAVNGEIRNPIRLLQLSKICDKYDIPVIQSAPLTYDNGWFSGFFDSDGSIYLNLSSSQMLITAGQKNRYLLDNLCELYGGSIYIEKTSFKWIVFKKSDIIKLIEYFRSNPCRSAKLNRINAISKYLELRSLKAHLSEDSTILGKA